VRALALLALLLAAPAVAQTAPALPPPAATPAATVDVALDTSAGRIVVALEKERAPITVANFLRYVDGKRFDGTAFYRAMKLPNDAGLVQFGTRNDPKKTLPPIAFEPTTKTGLSHTDGTLSMAMDRPGNASGDVFIAIGDLSSLDAKGAEPGFAAFGRVTEGMDVIKAILASPTSPTDGVGAMKGQMLAPTIVIRSARRLAR
jgi:peptidyl-prolyl cis-trans isomerase A (cyclophilin A)